MKITYWPVTFKELLLIGFLCWVVGFFSAVLSSPNFETKPSDILGFAPVCSTSTRQEIVVAQAEIQRLYLIPCKPDGEWGKQTAYGQCEILVMKENCNGILN